LIASFGEWTTTSESPLVTTKPSALVKAPSVLNATMPPVITSPLTAAGFVGQFFSYQITATEFPESFGATGLPGGLILDTFTGVISGTPAHAGTSSVTIGAANAFGTGTATLVITITDTSLFVPEITSSLSASGTVQVGFFYTITATNVPTTYAATGLPAHLTLNPTTGQISGIPVAAGTSNVAISASNASGADSEILIITISDDNGTVPPPPSTPAASSESSCGAGSGLSVSLLCAFYLVFQGFLFQRRRSPRSMT
jgi:hypothetical protein